MWAVVNMLVVVYALLPVLWILSLSLKPTSKVKDGKLIPSSMTLDNYRGIFRGDFFSSALINSIGIGLTTTVIAVVLGAMAAYAVARLNFPGKRRADRHDAADHDVPGDLAGDTVVRYRTRGSALFDTWPGLILPYITFALAACHLHAVGVLPGNPLGSGKGGQDGRRHAGSGVPQSDRPAGGSRDW